VGKIKICKTLIIPVATYRAECWAVNRYIGNWLITVESKVLRIMFVGIKFNDNWRKVYKKELMTMFGDFHILSFVRLRRLNWTGHVSRMDSRSKVFSNYRQESRLRGRPNNRWWN